MAAHTCRSRIRSPLQVMGSYNLISPGTNNETSYYRSQSSTWHDPTRSSLFNGIPLVRPIFYPKWIYTYPYITPTARAVDPNLHRQRLILEGRILETKIPMSRYGVSAAALLDSIVELGEGIESFKYENFVFHQRNCRQVIRLAGIVIAFLQEVRDNGCDVSDSAIAAMSELRLVFQKLVDLISGCAPLGSRVWIMLRSDRVTREFRLAVRTVATAVDALLIDGIGVVDVTAEGRDYGSLAAKQAWSLSSAIGVDPEDDRVSVDVVEVLNQFRKGVRPQRRIVRRVLNHLGIRSWIDCHEEVRLLEQEITMQLEESSDVKGSGRDSSEIDLLSSLLGLVIYSRSVMFDKIDGKKQVDNKIEDRRGKGELDCLNPEEFRCPISLEIMQDPVTVSTGLTYDRASIIQWLKRGNPSCPVTGKALTSQELIPNVFLKNLIQKFSPNRQIRGKRFPSDFPGNSVFTEAMRMLATFLVGELSTGSNEETGKAVYEIRHLTKSSDVSRACLVEAGCVPRLLHLLASWDPSTQVNSMAALMRLASHPDGLKAIFNSGGLSLVLDVLCHDLNAEAQQHAAATLVSFLAVDDYRDQIGETSEAIQPLVWMLKSESTRGKEIAMLALLGLLMFPCNHRNVIDSGLVPELILLLSSTREKLVTGSLSVLKYLAETPIGLRAIFHCPSSIPSMVDILRSSTSTAAKETCLSIFVLLSYTGSGIRVLSNPNQTIDLIPSLYSLVTDDGSPRAAKIARSLLNILQQYNNNNPKRPVVGNQEQGIIIR